MRFLADERCDFAGIRALRTAGHDVLAVAEISPRAEDQSVIDFAVREARLVLTADKDFRHLVYANRPPTGGVLLLRFPANARTDPATAVMELVRRRGEQLIGRFVVVQPGRVRISRIPEG